MGFFELKSMDLPSVQWKEYLGDEILDPDVLWTVRSAVFYGDDLNLPRAVGVTAQEATTFAKTLCSKLKDLGMVIYYPYFIANKSGTLNIYRDRIIVEAVPNDLWNLVTYSDRTVTYELSEKGIKADGKQTFLTDGELNQITSRVPAIRRAFRDDLLTGKSILLEWSLAQKSNIAKKPVGEEFLVFYELRTV